MYTSNDTAVIKLALTRGNTIVGNIMMRPEKTVMYEVGVENQFSDLIVAGLTAYFKDVYDLSQIREVEALPQPYFQYFNVDYGNVKGFEFSLRKRMASMWALSAVYTLQFAKGTASFAGEWYNDYYNWQINPPVIDYWLDFDERHTINVNFDVETPKDFFFIPLQNFASSIVFSYHSGQPYTPQDLRGNRIGDDNSARMSGYMNVDWSLSRQIAIGPVNMVISGMINNLFNTTQVNYVYSTTGEPDSHGDPEPSLGQFGNVGHTSSRYTPQADLNHDGLINPVEQKTDYIAATEDYYDNPLFYNNPLNIRLGIGLSF
jgi:outer membrane receptor protein involved in Fe transport